jgi:hypothetical protein
LNWVGAMAQIVHAASAEATKLNINAAENDLTSLLDIAQNSTITAANLDGSPYPACYARPAAIWYWYDQIEKSLSVYPGINWRECGRKSALDERTRFRVISRGCWRNRKSASLSGRSCGIWSSNMARQRPRISSGQNAHFHGSGDNAGCRRAHRLGSLVGHSWVETAGRVQIYANAV